MTNYKLMQHDKEFCTLLLADSARIGSTCASEWDEWFDQEQRELTDEREHREDL